MADYKGNYQKKNYPRDNTPLAKTALDEWKLRLEAPVQEGQKKPSTLGMFVVKNQPRLSVWTNLDGDPKPNEPIMAAMDTITAGALLELIGAAIHAEPDTMDQIVCRSGPPGQQTHTSTIYVGKDKQARVYISVISKDDSRPKIKFLFLPSDWHELRHGDGSRYSEPELTQLYAKSYLRTMSNLLATVLGTNYVDRSQDFKGGNKASTSSSSQSSQSSGGSQNYDQELPF